MSAIERLPPDALSRVMHLSDFPDAASLTLALRRRANPASFASTVERDLRPRADAYAGGNVRDTSLVRGHYPAGSLVNVHSSIRHSARVRRHRFEEALKYLQESRRTFLSLPRRLRRNGYRLRTDTAQVYGGPGAGYMTFELVERGGLPYVRLTWQDRATGAQEVRVFWIPQSDVRRIEPDAGGSLTPREAYAYSKAPRVHRYLTRHFSGPVSL
jgi:hypothetical protein